MVKDRIKDQFVMERKFDPGIVAAFSEKKA